MRDVEEQLQSGRRSVLRPLVDRVRPHLKPDTLTDVRKALDAAARTLLTEAPVSDLQQKINHRLTEMVGPRHTIDTTFDFAASDPEQLLRSLRLFLKDGKTRPIADASLGLANVLFLALLLQDLEDRRAAGAFAAAILGIEEPEAHLHPHVQRLLFRYALRRNSSVLVTTHSPSIASVAPLAALLVLRATKDGASRLHSAAGTALTELQVADLERYLDVTRAEMLFARGIIFVEGSAEQYLLPAFARHELIRRGLGGSLDEVGITICSVSGTDFRPYWRVTSGDGWDIPRVVVTDGDPKQLANTPAGPIVYRGLVRGADLTGDADIRAGAIAGQTRGFRNALGKMGVFVGEATLEIDLLASMHKEIKAAYEELRTTSAAKAFSKLVDAAIGGDREAGHTLVERIEVVGKGRFAQRLASKVTVEHEAPVYIRKALAYIFDLVGDV